jgi:hypothetical protein
MYSVDANAGNEDDHKRSIRILFKVIIYLIAVPK